MVEEVKDTVQVTDKKLETDSIIKDYTLYSMGTGLIPVPIFDLAAIIGLQIKMVHKLSGVYNIPFSEKRTRSILFSLLGGILPIVGVGLVASIVKFIPILGQSAGAVSMATLSGASTYTIGKVFVKHFEEGGTVDNLDIESAKEDLKDNIDEAKTKVNKMKKEA